MRILAFLMLCAARVPAADTIEAFGLKWSVPLASEWAVEGAGPDQVLRMLVAKPPTQPPRRPAQHAMALTRPFSEVTLEAEVKRNKSSLIIVYAWQDENHFDYAHLSVDTATKQPVHNGIFKVDGGDRVRISTKEGPNALPTDDWTPVRLVYSAKTGVVEVTVNGRKLPALRAEDKTFGAGRVGIGSFFEIAQFRKVRIKGK
jgi:hypothetical protein